MTDIADILDGLDLFREFPYPELKVIGRYLVRQTKRQGELIFSEGDPGDHMLILVEGRLSIFKGGERGNHLLSHEGRGRLIGEMALLDHERRSATCVADTACTVLVFNVDELNRLATDNPLIAYHFMFSLARLLSRRLRKTSGMLVEYLVT
jgi:CRP/FNR family cyclic AMP-dependent transcriptional regulator